MAVQGKASQRELRQEAQYEESMGFDF